MGEKQPVKTWEKIHVEYIGGMSMAALAEKYHVSKNSIEYRSKRDGWGAEREKHREKTRKRASALADRRAEAQMQRLKSASEKLMDKVENLLEALETSDIKDKPMILRQISGTIMDCQTIMGLKSPEERAEQQARIEMLRARAEAIRRENEPQRTETLEVTGLPEAYRI